MVAQYDITALKYIKYLKCPAQISLPNRKTFNNLHLRINFSRAHFEQLDSMIRHGKFHEVQFEEDSAFMEHQPLKTMKTMNTFVLTANCTLQKELLT